MPLTQILCESGEHKVPSITRDFNLCDSPVFDSQYKAHGSLDETKRDEDYIQLISIIRNKNLPPVNFALQVVLCRLNSAHWCALSFRIGV